MTTTACPACGIAVVPGYVKCPRCGARLPSVRFRRPGTTADPGGTAVETGRGLPVIPLAIGGVVVLAVVLVLVLRHRGGSGAAKEDVLAPPPVVATQPRAQPGPVLDTPPAFTPLAPGGRTAKTAAQVAGDLQVTLKRQRLWSTVEIVGTTLEIHSSTCGDPQMSPALDAVMASARAAGLTRLRCLEQSGAVATTREL